jgi:signal transduction histidine kinase
MEEPPTSRQEEQPCLAGSDETAKARAALSSLNLLVGTIAHALRGDLTGLDGGLYLLQSGRSRGDPARMEKGLAMLQRNLHKLRSTVSHILYYARDRELLLEPIATEAFVAELVEAVQKQPSAPGVEFRKDVTPCSSEFEADRNALRSALLNILAYAFEADSAPGPADGRPVRMEAGGRADEMVFTVEVPGKSLDRTLQERILSPLFLAKMEGAALGLFVANKILAAHGGALEIDSDAGGGGTIFRARIPLRPLSAAPEQAQGKAEDGRDRHRGTCREIKQEAS